MIKLFPNSKQDFFRILTIVAIPASFAGGYYLQEYFFQSVRSELADLRNQLALSGKSLKSSQEDYHNVVKDRENILIQTKRFMQENNRLVDVEKAYKKLVTEHEGLLKKTEKIETLNDELGRKTKEFEGKLKQLSAENQKLNEKVTSLTTDREKHLTDATELHQKNLILITEERDKLQIELQEAKKTGSEFEKKVKRSKDYEAKSKELKQEKEWLEKEIKDLRKKLKFRPGEVKDLAHENRTLIEETGKMHYNLGVFYVKQKQFKRAIPEFERAVALNPQDSKSLFNLGYIYAEEYVDFQKASDYFRRFLRIDPEDESADWVSHYLDTYGVFETQVLKK